MLKKWKAGLFFIIGSGFYFLLLLLPNQQKLCPFRGSADARKFPTPSFSNRFGTSVAMPVFSRKYGTSCQTCHTAFPNLTPFGEAFKRNGLRFPGEGDSFESPDSQTLGKEEDKKEFPKAVWTGAIPKSVPFSLAVNSQFTSHPKDNSTNQKAQFQDFGGNATFLTAGTLGNHFAFWGEFDVSVNTDVTTGDRTAEIMPTRLYAIANPFKGPEFQIKIGSFEPAFLFVSEHRNLLGGFYILNDRIIGDNNFTLEDSQQGLQLYGTLAKGHLGYAVAVVEGTSNHYNNDKDVIGRVEYKIGGLRLDGVQNEKSATVKHPWRDDTVTLGAFGYLGFASLNDPTAASTALQSDRFEMFGGDIHANYFNFNSELAYVRRQNSQPVYGTTGQSVGTNEFLGELNYVYYWFLPGIRYELSDNNIERDQKITLGSTFLVRPNIKTYVRGALEKLGGGKFTDNPEILAGITLAL